MFEEILLNVIVMVNVWKFTETDWGERIFCLKLDYLKRPSTVTSWRKNMVLVEENQ